MSSISGSSGFPVKNGSDVIQYLQRPDLSPKEISKTVKNYVLKTANLDKKDDYDSKMKVIEYVIHHLNPDDKKSLEKIKRISSLYGVISLKKGFSSEADIKEILSKMSDEDKLILLKKIPFEARSKQLGKLFLEGGALNTLFPKELVDALIEEGLRNFYFYLDVFDFANGRQNVTPISTFLELFTKELSQKHGPLFDHFLLNATTIEKRLVYERVVKMDPSLALQNWKLFEVDTVAITETLFDKFTPDQISENVEHFVAIIEDAILKLQNARPDKKIRTSNVIHQDQKYLNKLPGEIIDSLQNLQLYLNKLKSKENHQKDGHLWECIGERVPGSGDNIFRLRSDYDEKTGNGKSGGTSRLVLQYKVEKAILDKTEAIFRP